MAIAPVPWIAMNDELVIEGAGERADHVGVQARERVDAGEQPGGEAVGHALHAEHEAGDGVLAQRVPPDRKAASQVQSRQGYFGAPDRCWARGFNLHHPDRGAG